MCVWVGGKEGRRSAAFRAPNISPFTEVAATATLRLAGNGLAFCMNSFPSSASFFRFPSYEMLGFFLLFISIFVSVGSSKWFSFV